MAVSKTITSRANKARSSKKGTASKKNQTKPVSLFSMQHFSI